MSIQVKIGGSIAGLKAALKNGETAVNNFAKKLKSFRASGIGQAATMVVQKAVQEVSALINHLDEIGKRSRGLGITAEQMQQLEYAARSANVPVEQMVAAIPRMMDMVVEAGNGTQKAVSAFAKLGLSVKDLSGLSPYAMFEKIVSAINDIPDPAQRASAALDIFGKAFAKNMAFFQDFQANVANFKNSGRMISDADVRAAESIKQSLEDIDASKRKILADTGVMGFLARVAGDYASALGGDEKNARLRGGVHKTTGAVVLDMLTLGTRGWGLFQPSSMVENYAEALPLTRSSTRTATPTEAATAAAYAAVSAAMEDYESELLEQTDALTMAVDNLAAAVEPQKNPRAVMGRGGGDTALSDSIRRIGGNLGFNYGRAVENYAKTTAEAAKKTVAVLESMNNSGISLRA